MNTDLALRRAETSYIDAAKSYGHSFKGESKRDASKARRRLDKAIVKADGDAK